MKINSKKLKTIRTVLSLLLMATLMLVFSSSCKKTISVDLELYKTYNLTGTWESPEWGAMTLVQTENKITGTYVHDRGQLEGIFVGNQINFRWWELVDAGKPYESADKGQRGDAYFILPATAKGTSLNGEWRYEGDKSWQGKWTAVKKN
jgi:hypothetical protein